MDCTGETRGVGLLRAEIRFLLDEMVVSFHPVLHPPLSKDKSYAGNALTQRETITQQCAASCNELIFWSLRSINLNHSPNGWRGETGRAGKSLFVSGKTILLEVGWILRSSGSVNVKEARLRGKLCRLPRREGLLHCKIVFGTSLLTESWRHSIIAARMHDFSLRLDLRVPANFARFGQRFSIHCLIFQDKYFLYVRVIDRLNYTG